MREADEKQSVNALSCLDTTLKACCYYSSMWDDKGRATNDRYNQGFPGFLISGRTRASKQHGQIYS